MNAKVNQKQTQQKTDLPVVHNQDLVAIEHGVEPMGDRQHCAVSEDVSDRPLHQAVCFAIDCSGRLIQHYYARMTQNSSCHA